MVERKFKKFLFPTIIILIATLGLNFFGQNYFKSFLNSFSKNSSAQAAGEVHEIKTAALLIKFPDANIEPYTKEQVRQYIFDYTDDYFREVSFGKMAIVGKNNPDGDVYGWYLLNEDKSTCDINKWMRLAVDAVRAEGYDFSGYDKIVIINTSGCTGNSSGINSNWMFLSNLGLITHEFSHAIGMQHNGRIICQDAAGNRVPYSNNCTFYEYNDPWGSLGLYHPHNYYKAQLSWIEPEKVTTVTSNGIFDIYPQETPADGPQVVRVLQSMDADHKAKRYFYLEFRQPYGRDNFSPTDPVVNGVSIRLTGDHSSLINEPITRLIDTTPETTSFNDAPLGSGKTFIDPVNNITIKTLSITTEKATVEVTREAVDCVHNAPLLQLLPTATSSFAGELVNYKLKITNMDTLACGASNFSVSTVSVGDSTWQVAVTPKTQSINPGETKESAITVTSPATANTSNIYDCGFHVTVDNTLNYNWYNLAWGVHWITSAMPRIIKTYDFNETIPGSGEITYYLKAQNPSNSAIANITIRDPIPAGTSFVSASGNGTNVDGVVTWQLGSLDPNANINLDFKVKID